MNKPLTAIEAADFLHLTARTIRSYIKAGKLEAKKIGRKYLVRPEDLDRFVQEQG